MTEHQLVSQPERYWDRLFAPGGNRLSPSIAPRRNTTTRVSLVALAGIRAGGAKYASARLLAANDVPVLSLGRAEADLLAAGTASRLSQELRPDDAVVTARAGG